MNEVIDLINKKLEATKEINNRKRDLSKIEDILPKNEDGRLHGYCEEYWGNGNLNWKGVMVRGKMYGYRECYVWDGGISEYRTGYWMNNKISDDNEEGYCYIWDKEEL